jgi:hypothetical protein
MRGRVSPLKVVDGDCAQIILFDENLESYKPFFDDKWHTEISTLVEGSLLAIPVHNLCVNWMAASSAHSGPWLMFITVSGFALGLSRKREMLAAQVLGEHAKLTFRQFCQTTPSSTKKMRREVQARLEDVGKELRAEVERLQECTRDKWEASYFWAAYLNNRVSSDFKLSIWGAQRVCYGAIYHAYENFVRDCIAVVKGRSSYYDELFAGARSTLGKEVVDCCLTDPRVKLAYQIRNALAHNGGKETDKLREIRHGIHVKDGVLQIVPEDTVGLFDLLKEKVFRLANKAIELSGTHSS